jgi:hypothetical protein
MTAAFPVCVLLYGSLLQGGTRQGSSKIRSMVVRRRYLQMSERLVPYQSPPPVLHQPTEIRAFHAFPKKKEERERAQVGIDQPFSQVTAKTLTQPIPPLQLATTTISTPVNVCPWSLWAVGRW